MADRAWWWLLAWIAGGVVVALIGGASLPRPTPVAVDVQRYHTAPAQISLLVRVERDPANRNVRTAIESAEFFTSSDERLEGDRAPLIRWVRFQAVPAGDYEATATVSRADGRVVRAWASFVVVGRGSP